MSNTHGVLDYQRPAPDARERGVLIFSWLWVGIPAVWGIYHVVVDALKLFL